MDQNAMAIITLCSHLCVEEGIQPLQPHEWSALASRLRKQALCPADLLTRSPEELRETLELEPEQVQRLRRLLDRGGSLSFELSRYENMGIRVVTRAEPAYPKQLKKKLGNSCPPLFYCAGDLRLLDRPMTGYAGSRNISQEDLDFTVRTVHSTLARGYQVVTGGARGVDQAAEREALLSGGSAVAYLADSMLRRIKAAETLEALQNGRLLLLSVVKPDAGFQTGVAMMRNRYVYAQASGVVVVRADRKKGGTWNGAVDNLRHGWSTTLCWRNEGYPGNMALIEAGAVPVDEDWDGELPQVPAPPAEKQDEGETQLSLFV